MNATSFDRLVVALSRGLTRRALSTATAVILSLLVMRRAVAQDACGGCYEGESCIDGACWRTCQSSRDCRSKQKDDPCVNNSCAPGETHAKWNLNYQNRNIWHPGVFNNSETAPVPTMLLKEILLPDGSSFSMPVAATGSVNAYGGPAGELTKLVLPTLGHYEWSWNSWFYPEIHGYTGCLQQLPPDSNNWNSFSGVASRREYDIDNALLGETTYSRTVVDTNPTPPEYVTVRVESPLHDISLHYFSIWPGFPTACTTSAWGTGLADYAMPYMRDPALADTLDDEDPGSDVQRYLSSVHYDCPGGANPDLATCSKMRTVYQAWEIDEPDGAPWENGGVADRNRRLLSERTFYNDDTSGGVKWKLRRMSDFDGLGHYRSSISKANFISGHNRRQTTDWNSGRGTFPGDFVPIAPNEDWLLETYDSRTLEEDDVPRLSASAFTQIAREEFWFDDNGGFIQRHRRMASDDGVHAVGDTLLLRTADAKGNLVQEEWFGGDGVTLPEACTDAIAISNRFRMNHTVNGAGIRTSSQWKDAAGNSNLDLDFYALKRTIDPYTGWVTASQDVAGLQTAYVYDKMGRLKGVQPQASGGSGDAWEVYDYTVASSFASPAQVKHRAYTCCDSSTSPLIDEEWHYDGIGRLRRERRLDAETANTFNDRYTCYDAAGNRSYVSEWDRGEPSSGTACKSWINPGLAWSGFDPFGRPGKVSRYSNGTFQFDEAQLSYLGERKVTRTQWMATTLSGGVPTDSPVDRVEWFDDHGRLQSVNEVSDPSSSNYVATDYSYDVGNRLRRAATQQTFCPNPNCDPPPANQVRWSFFDQLGFLRRERSPERGSGGNSSIYLYDYDPLGNAQSKQDGDGTEGVVLSFDFDRASRLTKVTDESEGHILKEFAYNPLGGSSASDYRKGKLTQATSHNWIDFGDATFEAQFVETFVYGGVGGRRSKRTVSFAFGPAGGTIGQNEIFYHYEQFDGLGRRTSVVYPTCDAFTPDCNFSPPPRTVYSSYSEGFLRSVTEVGFDWISDITYHKSGLWNTITQGNMLAGIPVVTTQTPDAFKIARPAKIESAISTTTLWRSGTYAYDRSGNVRQILGNEEGGNDQFLYDKVGRLVRAELDVPNVSGSLRDAMIFNDGFESSTAGRWVDTWPPVSHPSSSVQTFSYDRFGNLLTMPIDGTGPSLSTSLATNHLSAGGYDGRGNLTSFSSNEYFFDNLNRLQRETKSTGESRYFLYTADDERILTYDPNLPSVFHFALRDFNGKVLRTFDRILPDPANVGNQYSAVGRDYIHAGDRVIGTEDPKQPGSTRMWATLDHLGTPRLWTGPNAEVLRKHKYYPYGEEMTPSDQWNVALQFTGHERDANNLGGPADDGDNMHARFASPVSSRFLSLDPAKGSANKPQGLNSYSYALGSPLTYVDPSGKTPEVVTTTQALKLGLAIRLLFKKKEAEAKVVGPVLPGKAIGKLLPGARGGIKGIDYYSIDLTGALDHKGTVGLTFQKAGLGVSTTVNVDRLEIEEFSGLFGPIQGNPLHPLDAELTTGFGAYMGVEMSGSLNKLLDYTLNYGIGELMQENIKYSEPPTPSLNIKE